MRLANFACTIAIAFLSVPLHAHALSKSTSHDEYVFEAQAIALSASERSRLTELAVRLLAAPWCVESLAAVGYADRSEGSAEHREKLARQRAAYVAEVLGRVGIRPSHAGPAQSNPYERREWHGVVSVEGNGLIDPPPGTRCINQK
jgi:hypothetical protein